MEKNKKTAIILGVVLIIVIAVIGISYAVMQATLSGNKNIIMSVGDIDVSLADDSVNVISVANGLPVTDTVGKQSSPYKFTIHNNGPRDVRINIYLENDSAQLSSCQTTNGTCNLLEDSVVKYQLITPTATTSDLLSNVSGRLIGTTTVIANGSNNCELRVWLDYNADNTSKGKYFFGKLKLDVTEISE